MVPSRLFLKYEADDGDWSFRETLGLYTHYIKRGLFGMKIEVCLYRENLLKLSHLASQKEIKEYLFEKFRAARKETKQIRILRKIKS